MADTQAVKLHKAHARPETRAVRLRLHSSALPGASYAAIDRVRYPGEPSFFVVTDPDI